MNDTENLDLTEIGGYVASHQWTLAAAVGLILFVRWFASRDVKGPLNIPGQWKPWVLFAAGAPAMAIVDKVASGKPWGEAVANGLMVAVFALTGHSLVVLPTGKDIGVPKVLKKDDSNNPPDDPTGGIGGPTVKRVFIPPATGLIALFRVFAPMVALIVSAFIPSMLVGVALTSCGGSKPSAASAMNTLDQLNDKAGQILGFVAPFLPPGDAQLIAAQASKASGQLHNAFAIGKLLLGRVQANGNDVPAQLFVDADEGAKAAQAIENFGRGVQCSSHPETCRDGVPVPRDAGAP